jgi:hypothetical protein
MSTTFWASISAGWLAVAVAPWEHPSYVHSWWDAAFYGVAAFCALRALSQKAKP